MIKLKHFFLAMACLAICGVVYSQTPQTLRYQAVVRYGNNTLVSQKLITVKSSILRGGIGGSPIYEEVHHITTDDNGLMSLEIGNGESNQNFSDIDWGQGPYFLKTEIDPEGGINYSIVAVNQMLSAPYAFYANTSTAKVPVGTVLENGNVAAGQQIKNLGNPTDYKNVATKAYVDSVSSEVTRSLLNGNRAGNQRTGK